ncbi:MAG: exosortase/archaeosortase family protein [Acidimicrobiales bacterium]|jgi:exosortase/archaeosortase family protein
MSDVLSIEGMRHKLTEARAWRQQWHLRWLHASHRTRIIIQVGALVGAVLVAYNYSLDTLLQNAGQETPLAYVSLVPAIALALAAIRARPLKPEPAIHDRQVDYTVGIPLIVAAMAINILLPARMSAMFWVYRIDLLTLPIFVAGAVAIIFGVRVLWRQKLAVLYLFLAWPYPYQSVLLKVLDAFTAATLWGIDNVLRFIPVAKPVSSLDNTLFMVTHNGHTFALSVVSACSGVNSVVGFLLVGSAFAAIVRGPMLIKLAWLFGGMAILWAINLGRITFIFWAGKTWGENVAINILHPFVGLVTFSVGVMFMVLMIKPLGMRIGIGEARPEPARAPVPVPELGAPMVRHTRTLAVPKVYLALTLAVVAALILGIVNLNLRTYNLVATASGEPRLVAYIDVPVAPAGWRLRLTSEYNWAKPLFGDTSVWNRYEMFATEGGDLHSNLPVVADVINTPDLSTFSAYGVENCYQFHGYSLADVAQVTLTGGVTGQAMSYTSQQFGSWSIVYWIVPVKMATGTNYERTVLYVQNTGDGAQVTGLTTSGIKNLAGSLDPSQAGQRALINNRTFLVAFARQLIKTQALRSASSTATTTQ